MTTELLLVEGVSDVQLISYYLQNVYGWRHEKSNKLGIVPLDDHENIESLVKNDKQLVLWGVGGNGKFAHFVERHRVNTMLIEKDISSVIVVADRDDARDEGIGRIINSSLENISVKAGKWLNHIIKDSYGQSKNINTYLLIIPVNEKGALERVIINALNDIPTEKDLIKKVLQFVDSVKGELVPELNQINKANKATVGTFFSIRYPKNAIKSFINNSEKAWWAIDVPHL